MRHPYVERCHTCGGSGFSGYGTGYGDICDDCAGGYSLIEFVDSQPEGSTPLKSDTTGALWAYLKP